MSLRRGSVLKLKTLGAALTTAALVVFSVSAPAYDGKPMSKPAGEQAAELKGVGIEEKLGKSIDLSTQVRDENGNLVALSTFFDGKHPVIISPVYFTCPGLCNFHLNGLTDGLKLMEKDWSVGNKFQVVALSFDSKETSELAAEKKKLYMKLYDRAGTEKGWHFATADEAAIQAFTQSVGFKFRWDKEANEWAHASAAIVLTPDGKISRYLPGISFQPQDIKLALNEATEGKIGNFVESLVLFCFKYDPHQSKYTLVAFNVMQIGGAVMILVMVVWLLPVYIRSRRAKKKAAGR